MSRLWPLERVQDCLCLMNPSVIRRRGVDRRDDWLRVGHALAVNSLRVYLHLMQAIISMHGITTICDVMIVKKSLLRYRYDMTSFPKLGSDLI